MLTEVFDLVVVGGGPVGLAAAVIVLEQNNFFNQAGSSNDLARMFRTMYTEDFMAELAKDAMKLWDKLESDSGSSLRWMSGLLNFGDKKFRGDSPEGTLIGPVPNLERLGINGQGNRRALPFKNLPPEWIGLFAPDNGVINVQLLLRSLLSLAKDYGAEAKQHTTDKTIWEVHAIRHDTDPALFKAKKILLPLAPTFGISLDLDIWEIVASYFNTNPGPNGTIFPSMSFQFAPNKHRRSQLFYGFPTVPWGPPMSLASPSTQPPAASRTPVNEFIKKHVVGVDPTVLAFTLSCLQTNVFDNMFVLDYLPKEYLAGGAEKSVVVFTAGWAMKFVPLLGKALAEMALDGKSDYARKEFEITRKDKKGKGIIKRVVRGKRGGHSMMMEELDVNDEVEGESAFTYEEQASGSSMRGCQNVGL
ncbi:hypothetical protein QC761_602240 [Podospora bellae-mahoneyi]|uniref:FAD dependent oxidoreductase domain-containing protein n=1 Tax=Podospora bellae-mahoneyi TaxID=2093777 RepID=A0ABR0FAV0_9PEZI|nr:hypothetical protein QC761_602240 [Podospora bellae-mahoneyi]